MKEKLLTPSYLLSSDGEVSEAGYHFLPVKTYEREVIAASRLRIKEWDYYYVGNRDIGFAFTVDDNGYMSLFSASFFDFKESFYRERSTMGAFPLGRLSLPPSPEKGDIHLAKSGFAFDFVIDGTARHLKAKVRNFFPGQDLEGSIDLVEENPNWMCIVTPFTKKGHFYYNCKKNCFKATGHFKIGVKEYDLGEHAHGVLDWGRGVWTYKNTWYWSSASDELPDGTPVGFNLGYGFGDTSAASENMFFLGKKAYKLGRVSFEIPTGAGGRDDFLREWKIVDEEGRLELSFKPSLYRHNDANALLIRSNQNQVFGLFEGTIEIEGHRLAIPPIFGFAEKVMNRW